MNVYLIFWGAVLISLIQVSWGKLFTIQGVIVPVLVIYIWWVDQKVSIVAQLGMVFLSGMMMDIMGGSRLGRHSFILLLVWGVIWLVGQRTIYNRTGSRVVALLVGVGAYLILSNWVMSNI